MKKISAILIDVDVVTKDNRSIIRLVLKRKKMFKMYDKDFYPYFYMETDKEIKKGVYNGIEIIGVEEVRKRIGPEEKVLKKITCSDPKEIPLIAKALGEFGKVYEKDIKFNKRYLIDKGLRPMNTVEIEYEGRYVKSIRDIGPKLDVNRLNALTFDIEVYNPHGIPREDEDPAIIISYADDLGVGAITWKESDIDGVANAKNEKEMIEKFCEILQQKDVDIVAGYNSSVFDIPYLKARANELGIKLKLGRGGSEPKIKKIGMTTHAKIEGRVHTDIYYLVRILAAAQAIKLERHTLEEVYKEMIGGSDWKVDMLSIYQMWDDDGKRKELVEYAIKDAKAAHEIFRKLYPLEVELARLTKITLPNISGSTTGQMVESLLMDESYKRGYLIPQKPAWAHDFSKPIQGAYVKLPSPGIYERIAVFDFRSLYPSIITSHNIDPYTINCGHEACKFGRNRAPNGFYFCTKEKGLVPSAILHLLELRKKIKSELKEAQRKGSSGEIAVLNARVAALKIVLNTVYGMLNYPKSRWYSRECAESITAFGRNYIQEVAKRAENKGFSVLYSDTDSIFILLGNKTEQDAMNFMEEINEWLPETMELELENIYKRGVFVSKKQEKETGAKKKYALVSEDGKIKIRGFELVRRDWSKIARETQKKVLEAILIDGSKEKALQIVRDVVKRLAEGNVPKDELVIYTQLRKEEYEVISPEFSAVEKARKRGHEIKVGSIIGYIITRKGKTISEKAELLDYAEDYDSEYYINHQVLPAVMKIIGELGYSEEDIKFEGKQSSLSDWM
ncbi:MAG: DNA-directed DNA polymerase [Candidatus Micrarchaeota archaeon]|nr:DNA-directed DNA polymerase [Candidatus Micrarchaeota archaeon]